MNHDWDIGKVHAVLVLVVQRLDRCVAVERSRTCAASDACPAFVVVLQPPTEPIPFRYVVGSLGLFWWSCLGASLRSRLDWGSIVGCEIRF